MGVVVFVFIHGCQRWHKVGGCGGGQFNEGSMVVYGLGVVGGSGRDGDGDPKVFLQPLEL